jgi:hypothetical protein
MSNHKIRLRLAPSPLAGEGWGGGMLRYRNRKRSKRVATERFNIK